MKVGDFVEVPFGKTKVTGVVWDEFEKDNSKKFKIKKVVNATKREHIKKIDNIKNDKIKKSLLELSKIFKPKWL